LAEKKLGDILKLRTGDLIRYKNSPLGLYYIHTKGTNFIRVHRVRDDFSKVLQIWDSLFIPAGDRDIELYLENWLKIHIVENFRENL
jgi:hypothetical protein